MTAPLRGVIQLNDERRRLFHSVLFVNSEQASRYANLVIFSPLIAVVGLALFCWTKRRKGPIWLQY